MLRCFIFLIFCYSCQEQEEYFCFKVVDGDTLWVKKNEKVVKVRIIYIDAPEMDQKAAIGIKSKNELSNKVLGKFVRLKILKKDIWNRSLASVFLEGVDIGKWMISIGQAYLYPFSKFSNLTEKRSYLKAQYSAQINRLGLWQRQKVMTPYYYRKGKRRKRSSKDMRLSPDGT